MTNKEGHDLHLLNYQSSIVIMYQKFHQNTLKMLMVLTNTYHIYDGGPYSYKDYKGYSIINGKYRNSFIDIINSM